MDNEKEVLRDRLERIRLILENAHFNPDFDQLDAIYRLAKTNHEKDENNDTFNTTK